MNKKNITLLALCATLMIPLGCKKFLDQKSKTALSKEAFFNKASDGIALVNSIYDTYQNADLLKKSIWYYANFQMHDFYNWGNDRFYNYYDIPSDFGAIRVFWQRAYVGIARANTAIEVIPDMKTRGVLSAALADRLLGEAYFLRGLTYYYLAGSFGGVPIELNPVTDGQNPRSTQDQVFQQVSADMKLAATLLPWGEDLPASEKGRATRGAAYSYGGAAQMWLKDYAGALATFNLVTGANNELTHYTLLPDFEKVNEYDMQNNSESVFEVQFEVAGTQSWGAGNEVAWISDFSWPEEISNFGYDYANPGLYYSYQDGDKRKLATVIGPGDTNISPGIIGRGGIQSYPLVKAGFTNSNAAVKAKYTGTDGNIINTCGTLADPWYGSDGDGLRTGYYCAKMWRDPTLDANSGASTIFGAQNQIMMRYSEVLISKAECQARTGAAAPAIATLKIVRDRAFGGSAPAVMKDGHTFDYTAEGDPITDPLEMCYSEYRHELAGEYSTFYDIRRAGVASAFIKKTYGTKDGNISMIVNPAWDQLKKLPKDGGIGLDPDKGGLQHGLYNTTLAPGHDLYPIPQIERGLNPNLTQNPAYGN